MSLQVRRPGEALLARRTPACQENPCLTARAADLTLGRTSTGEGEDVLDAARGFDR